MVNLECNVKNCMHNENNCCCKDTISVDGHCACSKDETCCKSFDERHMESFTNSTEHPKHSLDVMCEATNCVYNTEKVCHANHISISGINASTMDQTKCASFEMKY